MRTRPTWLFWVVAVIIYGFSVVVVEAVGLAIAMAADIAPFSSNVFLFIACVLALSCWYLVSKLRARTIWEIDIGGISSPSFGRIEWTEVAALYIGFPSVAAGGGYKIGWYRTLASFLQKSVAEIRIIKMRDGRLFLLDISSPAISNSGDVLGKLTGYLAGKIRPITELDHVDRTALRPPVSNRFLRPLKSAAE